MQSAEIDQQKITIVKREYFVRNTRSFIIIKRVLIYKIKGRRRSSIDGSGRVLMFVLVEGKSDEEPMKEY